MVDEDETYSFRRSGSFLDTLWLAAHLGAVVFIERKSMVELRAFGGGGGGGEVGVFRLGRFEVCTDPRTCFMI